jgi:tetratricopeptide (TPR) repeat protein
MKKVQLKRPGRGRRGWFLLGVFAVLVIIGGLRWREGQKRHRWLQTASIEQLATAAYKNEDDLEVFEHLGALTLKSEEWHRAARAYQRACEIAPDRLDNWVGWSKAIFQFGGFRPADAILTSYINDHPRDSRAYVERSALRRLAKRTEMAWHDADKATKLNPKLGEAWALRGDLSLDQGISGEGEQSFLKAKAVMPRSPWPYVGLYQSYVYQKRADDALNTARHIVEKFPAVDEGKLYLGEALVLSGNYEEARKALNEASKHEGHYRTMDRSSLQFLIGKSYFNQSNWKDALRHFQLADAIAPGNADLLFLMGRTYRAIGDKKAAEETMKRHKKVYDQTEKVRQYSAKINAEPQNPAHRLAFARWYRDNGMLSSAEIQYEDMIDRGLDVETAKRELRSLGASGVASE